MPTSILQTSSRRSEELRYVTANFSNLQGLRFVPFWAALLVLAQWANSHPELSRRHAVAAAFLVVLLGFAGLVWSSRWYRRRCGFVKSPQPAVSSGLISILHPEPTPRATGNSGGVHAATFFLMALYLVPELFRRFDHRFGQFGLLVVIFGVLPKMKGDSAGIPWVRLRRILSLTATVLICAIYLGHLFARLGKWEYLAAVSASLLLLDLYDHWLLTHLLTGSPAETPHA